MATAAGAAAAPAERQLLTHLPVPDLADTLHRWLLSLSPLTTADDFKASALRALRLMSSTPAHRGAVTGPMLQEALKARAKATAADGKSWLIDDWVRLMYTSWRLPLPINVSYFFLLEGSMFGRADTTAQEGLRLPFARAAALALSFASFRDLVFAGTIPPELSGGKALDVAMYRYLFHACRFPRPDNDGVRIYDGVGACAPLNAVVAMRRGKACLVSLDSSTAPGMRCGVPELAFRMQAAADAVDAGCAAHGTDAAPVGLFTAAHRDTWATAFGRMFGTAAAARQSHGPEVAAECLKELSVSQWDAMPATQAANLRALQTVESALCVICFDTAVGDSVALKSRNLLDGNGRNRWFDKAIQFIVSDDGTTGLIGEHSHSDGMPTAVVLNWMRTHMSSPDLMTSRVAGAPQRSLPAHHTAIPGGSHDCCSAQHDGTRVTPSPTHGWSLLHFDTSMVREEWAAASREYTALVEAHTLATLRWPSYGKDAIKGWGVSPDAWAQMAIQLAYFRWRGTLVPTYEPAHTRSFRWGRTACIRVVSDASAAWVRAMAPWKAGTTSTASVDHGSSDDSRAGVRAQQFTSSTLLHKLLRAASDRHSLTSRLASMGQDVDRHLLGLKLVRQDIDAKRALEAKTTGTAAAGNEAAVKPVADDAVAQFFALPTLSATSTWYISTSNLSVAGVDNWGWGEVVQGGIGVAYGVHDKHLTFNVVGERATGVHGFMEELEGALRDMATVADSAAGERARL